MCKGEESQHGIRAHLMRGACLIKRTRRRKEDTKGVAQEAKLKNLVIKEDTNQRRRQFVV